MLLLPAMALAKPKVNISVKAEKEVTVIENGKEVVKRVAAEEIEPGEILIYTLRYSNTGDEMATNVVFNDPIPKGTVYLAGSATGLGTDITFSIDGGKTYKKPTLLTYEVKLADGRVEKRVASPDEYTHIGWKIEAIPAGERGELAFKVRVK
jgi:uncharacterized repeat protein (TIGR01451 family)